ncbi:cupin domain-containing protein [Mesorhizobium sp. SP-1A]|uniref:cupin domain-containing protein n=1 Tax=Mesorhizobium sp. SP-1A TaxID=3077840 RepID=UPI0028F6C990|nr:cupin domain-containing protein [Mesorhizobium sp. SP-1A]
MAIRAFHRDNPSMRLPLISKDARFIIWPGTDAWVANLNYVLLEPGEANKPHVHTESEDTIFILDGEGTIYDYTNDISLPFHAGCVVHVPVGVKHAVHADRGKGIVSVGGPSPADVPLLKAVGALPKDALPPE